MSDYRDSLPARSVEDIERELLEETSDSDVRWHAAGAERRYKLLSSADLKLLPSPSWRVKNVLPEIGFCSIYGPSGAGKSFLTLDLALAISEGSLWFGFRTKPTTVVYVALEGESGLRLRLDAWGKANKRPIPNDFHAILQGFSLVGRQDALDLAECVPHGSVVFIDTLNRAAPAVDENASRDMGQVISGAKELQQAIRGLVVVIHHAGKDPTRGMRGHSSLHAALDGSIEVERNGNSRVWRLAKAKDGTDGDEFAFELQRHFLGSDNDGDEITSCTIQPTKKSALVLQPPKGPDQKRALQAIKDALRKSSTMGMAGCPSSQPCVKADDLTLVIAALLTTTERNKRTNRARKLLTDLRHSGHIHTGLDKDDNGWIWIPKSTDSQSSVHHPIGWVDIVDREAAVETSKESTLDTVDTQESADGEATGSRGAAINSVDSFV